MLFPMGLGQKLPRFPLATVLITLVTIAVHFFIQPDLQSIAQRTADLALQHDLQNRAKDLFIDFCEERHDGASRCQMYAPAVTALYRHPEADDFKRFSKEEVESDERELRRAARLHERYLASRKDSLDFHYFQTVRTFLSLRHDQAAQLQNLASFPEFKESLVAFESEVRQLHNMQGFLSPLNANLASIFYAQFQHTGLLHLALNLFILCAFGFYVENRIGPFSLTLFYMTGGSLALTLQVSLMHEASTVLLGASGNVSVVSGLFYALFFRFSMRLMIPLFITYEKFYAPIIYMLPLILVVSDLSGAFGVKNSLMETQGSVAHVAHLTGFLWGALWGMIIAKTQPLPWPFLYPSEVASYKRLQATTDLSLKLRNAREMLRCNFENIFVKLDAILAVYSEPHFATREAYLEQNQATDFLFQHLQGVLAVALARKDIETLRRIARATPFHLPLGIYHARLGQGTTLKLADFLLAERQFGEALRTYDSFLMRYSLTGEATAVWETVKSLVSQMRRVPEGNKYLNRYMECELHTMLRPLLNAGDKGAVLGS